MKRHRPRARPREACDIGGKLRRLARFGAYLSVLCAIPLVTLGQQLPVEVQQTTATYPRPATLAAAPSSLQSPKVGLAPHERPACQLPTGSRRNSMVAMAPKADQDAASSVQKFPGLSETLMTNSSNQESTTSVSPPNVPSPIPTQGISRPAAPNNLKPENSERLRQLRQLLVSNNYDAYLVTPYDEHGMEYVSEYDRRLRFISGFTGSNGYALVLLDRAVLFTDGRYALQADLDLDCNWWLVVGSDPVDDISRWLKANAPKGLKVATDARLMPLQVCDTLDDQLKSMESEFVLISQDLVDVVWNAAQASGNEPNRLTSQEAIFVHPLKFAGNFSWQEKLVELSDSMGKLRARHYVISQLDDIAWLLNLRGGDIPMAPLFKSYLIVSRTIEPAGGSLQPVRAGQVSQLLLKKESNPRDPVKVQLVQEPRILQVQPSQTIRVTLYVDLSKINKQIRDHLRLDADNGTVFVSSAASFGSKLQRSVDSLEAPQVPLTTRIQIELKDYEVFIMDLRDKLAPAAGTRQMQGKLLLDASANVAIHVLSKTYDDRLVLVESLTGKLKAVKNDAEVQGMRLAHWRDSLAISMLLSQLDSDIGSMGLTQKWSETSAARELEFYRSLMDYNRGQSFDSIAAYGSNAAIVHYKPNESEPRLIGNQSTFLLDTGGQYLDGTTDITRTVHFGEPTDFQRETYTRVLMGAIDMMSLIFHQSQYKLGDLAARRHLFELGLDYAHGTGHGIGLFSMVHESPWLLEQYTASANSLRACVNKQRAQSGPQVLSDPVALQANMFTSVEPGYYKANDFGIRLENIVVSQRADLQRTNDRQETKREVAAESTRPFLRFEPISLVPFEPKLIKYELLSNKQKTWLNSYNLMVRFRLTQQINYYLAKIRNLPEASKAQLNDTQWAANAQFGYYNFLRLDGAQLQRKLELTHKWIMAKTEIVPLDVPRSLVTSAAADEAGGGGALSFRGSSRKSSGDVAPDDQRLMLAYMSSLPFNDAEAGEAMADLYEQSALNARGPTAPARGNSSGNGAGARPPIKCSGGIECDLLLVGALNSQQQKLKQKRLEQTADAGHWTGDADDDTLPLPGPGLELTSASFLPDVSFGSLVDMFRLTGPSGGQSANVLGVWSALILSAFVALQLGIVAYMCRSGASGRRNIRGAHSPNGSQSNERSLAGWFRANRSAAAQPLRGGVQLQQTTSGRCCSPKPVGPSLAANSPASSLAGARLDSISAAD